MLLVEISTRNDTSGAANQGRAACIANLDRQIPPSPQCTEFPRHLKKKVTDQIYDLL